MQVLHRFPGAAGGSIRSGLRVRLSFVERNDPSGSVPGSGKPCSRSNVRRALLGSAGERLRKLHREFLFYNAARPFDDDRLREAPRPERLHEESAGRRLRFRSFNS